MTFRVNVKRTVRIDVPGVSAGQMREFGQLAIDVQRARILRGINIDDMAASALSRGYAKYKVRKGLPAVRNMFLTGKLLESMKVTRAKDGSVRIGFADRESYIKAHVNQMRDEMFGLSAADQERIIEEIHGQWRRNLLGAVAVSSVAYGIAALMAQPVQQSGSVLYMPDRSGQMRLAA